MRPIHRLLLFIGLCIIGLIFMASYTVSGILTLLSFIALVENVPLLKRICMSLHRVVDVIIFAFAIYSKFNFGVTIAMAIMVAGLGYSMVYGPYLSHLRRLKRYERSNSV